MFDGRSVLVLRVDDVKVMSSVCWCLSYLLYWVVSEAICQIGSQSAVCQAERWCERC